MKRTMILPSREEFVALAADHDVVPVAREVYADLATPISAFMALAEGAEHAFLLESVIGGERLGRYSFLGVGDRAVITARGNEVVVENGGVSRRARRRPAARRGPRAGRRAAWRACRGCRCSWAARWATWATRPRPPSSGSRGTTTTSSACRTSASCMADIVVAFDHARRVMQVIAPGASRAAPPSSRTTRRSSASTATSSASTQGPRGAELGAVGVTRDGAARGAHLARGVHRAGRSAPRSTSRPATSSRSCSRSASRRPTRATGSTSTACCAR